MRAKDWGSVVLLFLRFGRRGREGRVRGFLGAEGALPAGESTMEVEGGILVGRMDGSRRMLDLDQYGEEEGGVKANGGDIAVYRL